MATPSAVQIADATTVIRRLTGSRWVWPPMRVREVYPVSSGRVRLVGQPVRSVVSVTDPALGGEVGYVLSRIGWLDLGPGGGGACGPRRVEVIYEYGSEPPAAIMRAITVLAEEFELAAAEDGRCRLPERVTSVSRQGVSWTLIDPLDFLDNRRTGIVEIDLIIAAFGTPRVKARVSSPEFPMPERLEITRLPVPPAEPAGSGAVYVDPDDDGVLVIEEGSL